MNSTKLLTIAEFAKRAKVSKQAIYKELRKEDGRLSTYVSTIDNQKMLKASALEEVYGVHDSQPQSTTVNQNNAVYDELIAMLRKELEQKDEQIKELHELLSQEQKLNALSQQKLNMLGVNPEKKAETEQHEVEQPKKRGLMSWLFGQS